MKISCFVTKSNSFFAIEMNHRHGAEFLQLSTRFETFSEAQARCRLLNAPNGSTQFRKKDWTTVLTA